jgi:hypothetical protein
MLTVGAEEIRAALIPYFGPAETIQIPSPPLTTVDRFVGREGVTVFVTGGLSAIALKQETKSEPISQELLFACLGDHRRDVLALLAIIAEQVARRGTALERGEVLGPAGPVVQGSSLTAFVATLPVFVPDEAVFFPGDPATVVVWLLPLSTSEAQLARKLGPDRFEQLLTRMAATADLYDLGRSEIVNA